MKSTKAGTHIKEVLKTLSLYERLNSLIKSEESIFRIVTSFKLAFPPLVTTIILVVILWVTLNINLFYFEAHGYGGMSELTEAYFQYTFKGVFDVLWFLGAFLVFSIFLGYYIAELLLRPFRQIADHCDKMVEEKEADYEADFFTDLKLLTSFSEYFFNIIEVAKETKNFKNVPIPKKFTRIHRPIFERSFLFHYLLLMLIVAGVSSVGIYIISTGVYESMIQLSLDTLKQTASSTYFFREQALLMDHLLWGVLGIQVLLYVILAAHFYQKVAGPAFGIFATLRSFLKGKHSSRIHLIGYYYIRSYSRRINRYLDYLQRNFINSPK